MAGGGATTKTRPGPAKRRVLAVLGDAPGPWTVDEVAARLRITPATARKHLDDLARDGLVQADSERSGRPGRPRLRYRLSTLSALDGPYQRLSRLLLEVIAAGQSPEAVGRRLGAQLGATTSGEQALLEAMAAEGFEPELADGPDGRVMTFHRCPYAAVASDAPGVVCALHRGFAAGLLDGDGALDGAGDSNGQGQGSAVGRLEIRDPRLAGCRLHLHAAG